MPHPVSYSAYYFHDDGISAAWVAINPDHTFGHWVVNHSRTGTELDDILSRPQGAKLTYLICTDLTQLSLVQEMAINLKGLNLEFTDSPNHYAWRLLSKRTEAVVQSLQLHTMNETGRDSSMIITDKPQMLWCRPCLPDLVIRVGENIEGFGLEDILMYRKYILAPKRPSNLVIPPSVEIDTEETQNALFN